MKARNDKMKAHRPHPSRPRRKKSRAPGQAPSPAPKAVAAAFPEDDCYRTSFDGSPIGMALVSLDGRFLSANRSLCETLGFTESELKKRTVSSVLHPDDIKADAEAHKTAQAHPHAPFERERRHLHADGHSVWVKVRIAAIKDRADTTHCFIEHTEDISRQKQAELALQISERRYRDLLTTIELIAVVQDRDGRITFCNDFLLSRTGWKREELLGKDWFEIFVPKDIRGNLRKAFDLRVHTSSIEPYHENDIVTRDGRLLTVRWSNTMLRDSKGIGIGIASIGEDITERRRAENALRESEARHRLVLDHIDELVYMLVGSMHERFAGSVRIVSGRVEGITGTHPDEFRGDPFLWFKLIHPEDMERMRASTEQIYRTGRAQTREYRIRNRLTGEYRWIEDHAVPQIDPSGQVVGLFGVGRDITDRKRSEATLRESEEKFRELAEQSPNMIFINQGGRVVYANKKCEEMMGYRREEFYSPSFDYVTLIDEESVDLVRRSFERHRRGEDLPPYEYRLRSRTGKVIDGLHTTAIIQYGGAAAILGIVTDITARKSTEKELATLRQAVESSGEVVFMTDHKGIFTYVNPEFTRLYGYEEEEVVGKLTPSVLKGGVRSSSNRKELWEPMHSGRIVRGEIQNKTKDGRLIDVEGTFSPIVDDAGRLTGYLAIQRNIGQRKTAEMALQQSENRFRALIEKSSDVIGVISAEGVTLYKSPSVKEVMGYDPSELIGRPLAEMIHPDDISALNALITDLVQQPEESHSMTVRHRNRDGSWRWIEAAATNHLNDPAIAGIVVNYRDISEQRVAEEKIREQAALLDISQDAILVRDIEDRIIYWNKGAEEVYGWTAAEAVGQPADALLFAGPSRQVKEAEQIVMQSGEWSGELHQIRKDKAPITVQSRWTLIRDINGRPTSKLVVNTDITEKKKLERQFLRTQRMESVGTLASGIAHDLNNILAPITMSLHLLRSKLPHEDDQRILDTLESSAQRGADLIKQVLTFSRGMEMERTILQVRHLLNDMRRFSRETFPANIEVLAEVPRDLWTVSGDATQIHQILLNLCVNSRDAMPNGGTLRIGAENFIADEHYVQLNQEAKVGPYIVITVSDTGVGMTPEIRERIFEPFFTTKEVGKGTGLGLSTVFALVKNHGGFLTVDSEVGQGSTFRVYLPALESGVTPRKPRRPERTEKGTGQLILVVDDEPPVCEITRLTLEKNGYRVVIAHDGAEALAEYFSQKTPVDLVLTDLNMPIMDGPALIRALKKLDPSIRIIAATGIADKTKLGEIAESDLKAFLAKPFTAEKLLASLSEALA
jgi:PAS domain S-box-containing protein